MCRATLDAPGASRSGGSAAPLQSRAAPEATPTREGSEDGSTAALVVATVEDEDDFLAGAGGELEEAEAPGAIDESEGDSAGSDLEGETGAEDGSGALQDAEGGAAGQLKAPPSMNPHSLRKTGGFQRPAA